MVVGGCDKMGESGMGDSGWGMVRVTLGWGSGGANFGRWPCGGNGRSPRGWAGWVSFQGGVLFAAFFSSRARALGFPPLCGTYWRHIAMVGSSWVPACGWGLGAMGRGVGGGHPFLAEYCGSWRRDWIFSRMVPWPFSWAQVRRLWVEGSLLLVFVILVSGSMSRKMGRKSAAVLCHTPVAWRHSHTARSWGGSRSVCVLSLRWLAARSPTFLRASFPLGFFPIAPDMSVSLSELVSMWTFTFSMEMSITVRYLVMSRRILVSVGISIFVIKGERMCVMFFKSEFNLKKSFIMPAVRNGVVKVGISRN